MASTTGAIVVGYDGSPGSRAALDWAVAEAVRRNAPLRVVEAFELVLWSRPGPGTAAQLDALVLARRRGLEAVADGIRAGHPQLRIEVELGRDPSAMVLVRESERARLVVLGTRGLGGWSGLVVGSVSAQVAAHAHCPVVVVPSDVRPRAREAPSVVVGVDGSKTSARAIEFAFEHADLHAERVVAVLAWTSPVATGGDKPEPLLFEPEEIESSLRVTLAESMAGAIADHPDVEVEIRLVNGRPARALVEAGESADLLVVGSRGRGGFTGLLLGSTSQSVLHHAHCPVAIVR